MLKKNFITGNKLVRSAIASVMNHPLIKKLEANHPETFRFFSNRFSLKKFRGLPFTLLIASFIANLILLSKLVEHLVNSPWMILIDKSFASFLFQVRITWFAEVMYYFSMLGSVSIVLIVASISTVVFLIKKMNNFLVPLWMALAGTGLTVSIGKHYFHRIRPVDFSYYQLESYSFPSGHATLSVAFYGALFYSIVRHAKSNRSKIKWMTTAVFFVLTLGFTRLYLCVHYLSDVLTGYSLGLLWLLMAISMAEWNYARK